MFIDLKCSFLGTSERSYDSSEAILRNIGVYLLLRVVRQSMDLPLAFLYFAIKLAILSLQPNLLQNIRLLRLRRVYFFLESVIIGLLYFLKRLNFGHKMRGLRKIFIDFLHPYGGIYFAGLNHVALIKFHLVMLDRWVLSWSSSPSG